MKQSLINDYLKALNTLVNDNRITLAITCNYLDKCHIVAYWCKNQVLHNFILFNDSSIVSYDNLVNDYLAIMAKHPMKQDDKQLFSLRYDSHGYCSLAITDEHNLELFGVSHKRISKQLAKTLYEYAKDNYDYYKQNYTKYLNTYQFKIDYLFKL